MIQNLKKNLEQQQHRPRDVIHSERVFEIGERFDIGIGTALRRFGSVDDLCRSVTVKLLHTMPPRVKTTTPYFSSSFICAALHRTCSSSLLITVYVYSRN